MKSVTCFLFPAVVILSLAAGAQDDKSAPVVSPAPAPVVATERELHPTLSLKGVVAPSNVTEVKLDLKAYKAPLEVVTIAAHGSAVKQGDTLVTFDVVKLKEAVEDAAQAAENAEHGLKVAQKNFDFARENTEAAMSALKQNLEDARNSLEYYKKVEAPMEHEGAQVSLDQTRAGVDNVREELQQLEKMYKESELAVDTQEIVLNRTRRGLRFAEVNLRHEEEAFKRFVSFDHPKKMRDKELAVKNAERGCRQAQENAALEEQPKTRALERARKELEKARKSLAELQGDLEAVHLRAPCSGVLVHGTLNAFLEPARPQGMSALTYGTAVKENLNPGQVAFTIYRPDEYKIVAKAPEKKFPGLCCDLAGSATVSAFPGKTFTGKVTNVALLPDVDGPGKAFWLAVALDGKNEDLRPALNADVKLTLKTVKGLAVPNSAVYDKAGESYCKLKSGEEKKVVVGAADDEYTQILDGLKAGDELQGK